MFPTGAAGAALVLLRLSVAATVVVQFLRYWPTNFPAWSVWSVALMALPLVIGIYTPLMSALCGLFELIFLTYVDQPDWPFLVSSIVYAIALALLGPGAYSFDGRRFGRRLIVTSVSDPARSSSDP